MFMQSIINHHANARRQSVVRQNNSSVYNTSVSSQRQTLVFNNGYNFRRVSQPSSSTTSPPLPPLPPSPPPSPQPPQNDSNTSHYEEIPTRIQHRLFNTTIEVNTNNPTNNTHNNPNQYYSTFEYESLNIRFFHNVPLNLQNINNEIDNVLNSINEREIQTIFSNFQLNEHEEFINNTLDTNSNTLTNANDVIEQIEKNTIHGEYASYKSILKNHRCPILLNDFVDDDMISLFKMCNHAIDNSTFEQYSKTFVKCPLCNHKLFN